MKWFKHMSSSADDEAMSMLIDEYGIEGYGIYWAIVEKIASQMDGSGRCSARYSVQRWASFARISPRKLQKVVSFLANRDNFPTKEPVFFAIKKGKHIEIECRNLLNYQDEYTRKRRKNSGQTPDKLRTNSGQAPDQRIEREVDIYKEEKEKSIKKEKPRQSKVSTRFDPMSMRPAGVSTDAWKALIEHRKKKRAANTERAYTLLLKEFAKTDLTTEECIDMMILRDWRGFKAEWAQRELSPTGQVRPMSVRDAIFLQNEMMAAKLNEMREREEAGYGRESTDEWQQGGYPGDGPQGDCLLEHKVQ